MNQQRVEQLKVVTGMTTPAPNTMSTAVALFDETGSPLSLPPVGSDVLLTGYTAGTAGDVAATDTLAEAIAKLEARIVALENP